MTTLSVTDSTTDLIETLTIAVAAVGILDDETRSKHCPRMERLLAAARESSATTKAQEALAKAWDEGYDVGYEDQRYRDTTKPMPPNPYASEEPS